MNIEVKWRPRATEEKPYLEGYKAEYYRLTIQLIRSRPVGQKRKYPAEEEDHYALYIDYPNVETGGILTIKSKIWRYTDELALAEAGEILKNLVTAIVGDGHNFKKPKPLATGGTNEAG